MQFDGWPCHMIGIGKSELFAGFSVLRVIPTRILFAAGMAEPNQGGEPSR